MSVFGNVNGPKDQTVSTRLLVGRCSERRDTPMWKLEKLGIWGCSKNRQIFCSPRIQTPPKNRIEGYDPILRILASIPFRGRTNGVWGFKGKTHPLKVTCIHLVALFFSFKGCFASKPRFLRKMIKWEIAHICLYKTTYQSTFLSGCQLNLKGWWIDALKRNHLDFFVMTCR